MIVTLHNDNALLHTRTCTHIYIITDDHKIHTLEALHKNSQYETKN